VNFTVDGSSMKDNVIFPAIHKVTFIENNVTSGINWGIKLSSNGTCINYSHSTLSQSMTVYLPDGNYTYHAYYSNHSTCVFMPERVFTVHNTSLNFLLTFGTTYNVTFKEKGLPSWDFWCVTFHGIKKKSYNSTIIFPAVNGTYSYTVKNLSGYTVSSSNLVRVNGNNVTQEIIFKHDVKKTPFVLSRTEIYAAVGIIIVIVLITISIILIIRKNKYNSEL
jgi:thermopsin